jgi:MYXO-CTERM domain-containing protein
MRADLSQAALATDLILQAAADQTTLSNSYQATLSINAQCPVCTCGSGNGGSGGGSFPGFGGGSSGSTGSGSGFGSSSGSMGSSMGSVVDGGNHSAAAPGQQSFGCSASSSTAASGAGLFAGLAGLVGLVLLGARARRKR